MADGLQINIMEKEQGEAKMFSAWHLGREQGNSAREEGTRYHTQLLSRKAKV